MRTKLCVALIGLLALAAFPASAQEEYIPDEKPKSEMKTDGLKMYATPAFAFSLTDNKNVIGQPEGTTILLNGSIDLGLKYREDKHELRLSLFVNEAFTYSPVLDAFLKATDMFQFEAMYLYHFMEWIGIYARFGFNTSLFAYTDQQAGPVDYKITYLNGTDTNITDDNLQLTDSFAPITLREAVGIFALPIESDPFNAELRAGFGGMHILADGQFVLNDDDGTSEIEVYELQDVNSAVFEFALSLWGMFYENKITWKAGAEAVVPVVDDYDDPEDRGMGELTNIEFYAGLSFRLLKWMSLDYKFRAFRQPQLLDDWQIQNVLLLTATYNFLYPETNE